MSDIIKKFKNSSHVMKTCLICGQEKLIDLFSRDNKAKDKHQSYCKACALSENQKYRKSAKGKATLQRRVEDYQAGYDPDAKSLKTCTGCGEEKPIDEFHRNRTHPDGHQHSCKMCCLSAVKKYHASEEGQARRKEYLEFEGGKAKGKEYRESAAGRAKRKEYVDSEAGKAARKKYAQSEAGKAACKIRIDRYKKTPKGKLQVRKDVRKRRALKLGATVGPVDEQAVYDFCGNKCAYCGSKEDLSLDHVIALSQGGPHCESNLLVACIPCNSSKGIKPVAEWLGTRPMTRADN